MTTPEVRKQRLGLLTEMTRDYHMAFCVVRPGVPEKPKSEQKICLAQIYDYAKVCGFDANTVDDLMDEAERQYAKYAEVA